ncbi:MAG: hypothetical protein ABL973_11210 [Micropepsaceae bacterium]
MEYYLRMDPNGNAMGVWRIDDTTAERIGVSKQAPGSYFTAKAGESIWDSIRRHAESWFSPDGAIAFHKLDLLPGQYYPRIARPGDQHPHEAPGTNPGIHMERNLVAMAVGQLTALTRQLDRICRTIHPSIETFDTYGHDIRNLLILACTEIEMYWRGVLVANGVIKTRFSTNEYVGLLHAMKLNEYAVSFPQYPWLEPIAPFKEWGSTIRPTQDLRWYDSYNAIKHDRENQFSKATLLHAFEALGACYIMMAASFGVTELRPRSELQAYYCLTKVPLWSPSAVYTHPYDTDPAKWTPVKYPFLKP